MQRLHQPPLPTQQHRQVLPLEEEHTGLLARGRGSHADGVATDVDSQAAHLWCIEKSICTGSTSHHHTHLGQCPNSTPCVRVLEEPSESTRWSVAFDTQWPV